MMSFDSYEEDLTHGTTHTHIHIYMWSWYRRKDPGLLDKW